MHMKSLSAAAIALTCLLAPTYGQTMPDNIRQHISKMLIGDWEEATTYDGKTTRGAFSWRWSSTKETIICSWRGDGYTISQVGHWDPKTKAVVFRGQSSRGDYWTTQYDKLKKDKWSGNGTGSWEGKEWQSTVSITWTDGDGSYVYEDITEDKPFITKGRRAAPIDSAQALKSFGRFMKGTWTRTDDGFKRAHKYTWGLDRKFMRSNGRKDPKPWDGFIGIDHSVGKVGWWGFFADGTSGVIHLTKVGDGEWTFEGKDYDADGPFHRKVVIKKIGKNNLQGRVEDTKNGKIQEPVIDETWERDSLGKTSTKDDFAEFLQAMKGRWLGEIKLPNDIPGIGKRGDKKTVSVENTMVVDGSAMTAKGTDKSGGSVATLIYYDVPTRQIRRQMVFSGGTIVADVVVKTDGKWVAVGTTVGADGTKIEGRNVLVISDSGDTHTWTRGDVSNVWRRVSK